MTTHDILFTLGRLLLGGSFFAFGFRNTGRIDTLTKALEAKSIPQARILIIIGVVMQIIGGAATALGPWPAIGAAILAVFVIVAVFLFHPFWQYQGDERVPHTNAAIMNTALVGAFLLLIAASV